jgi:enoyl-CoA hydratase/carnithine racemase
MSFSTFTLQQDGALLRVTFNNPPVNLMSFRMIQDLFALGGRLHADRDVKVVLFDSADPDFFIAHVDISDLSKEVQGEVAGSKYPDINGLQALTLSWKALPQVKIAKIDGRLRGGGLEFVLGAMDMRFATEGSKLCFPEASAGFLACGGGTTFLSLAAGPARALEVLLSARDFSGVEAERYGFINRALPSAQIDDYLQDLIGRLLARSRDVVAMHRAVQAKLFAGIIEPLFGALAAECDGLRLGEAGPDMLPGMKAMLAVGQTRENELDLPATMARIAAAGGERGSD